MFKINPSVSNAVTPVSVDKTGRPSSCLQPMDEPVHTTHHVYKSDICMSKQRCIEKGMMCIESTQQKKYKKVPRGKTRSKIGERVSCIILELTKCPAKKLI